MPLFRDVTWVLAWTVVAIAAFLVFDAWLCKTMHAWKSWCLITAVLTVIMQWIPAAAWPVLWSVWLICAFCFALTLYKAWRALQAQRVLASAAWQRQTLALMEAADDHK